MYEKWRRPSICETGFFYNIYILYRYIIKKTRSQMLGRHHVLGKKNGEIVTAERIRGNSNCREITGNRMLLSKKMDLKK